MGTEALSIHPGQALGLFGLGASLQAILTIIKADQIGYPAIEVNYSQQQPLSAPVVISLPQNGLRLRFDGADQRLRLIEVLDFRKVQLSYKANELVKAREDNVTLSGPAFRRIYQIFGAAYPGEYLAPRQGGSTGTYVLSWPGVAFNFPLQHSAWSPEKDHVSLLSSHVASPASQMAIFEGESWSEGRRDLFVRVPSRPRSLNLASRPKDAQPAEIELATIRRKGEISFSRRSPAQSFKIRLNVTTPQDLITELGPPDTTHRRELTSHAPEQASHKRTGSVSKSSSNGRMQAGSQPSSYSSTGTDTYETDFDSEDIDDDPAERANREMFWCYFGHGMDILVGPPSPMSDSSYDMSVASQASPQLVVIRVVVHGNVPGSYAFNRHRRLRWKLDLDSNLAQMNSESNFETVIRSCLLETFSGVWPESEMARGKIINRTWGAGAGDSSFFLPDEGEDLVEGGGSEQWLGNTKLYQFPGLGFEVLESGAVIAVTIS